MSLEGEYHVTVRRLSPRLPAGERVDATREGRRHCEE